MDSQSITIMKKVWKHSSQRGLVWLPTITNISSKNPRFHEGHSLLSSDEDIPDYDPDVDSYWTPAVASKDSRAASSYKAQRVLWIDCDDSYDDKILTSLKPSFLWETSPGHKQAIWLMKERVSPEEYSRSGLMGMLTMAVGGDKSGVDIGQLLRVPGSVHHKHGAHQGRILGSSAVVCTRGMLLGRVAKALGFSPALASELGADDPYGDRSKLLWKFSRTAYELGINEELTFRLLRACHWNKWKGEDQLLREDIHKAYEVGGSTKEEDSQEENEELFWELSSTDQFGPSARKPIKWLVPKIIPQSGCGLIVSSPKIGKTRVAMEISLGLATGKNPLGLSIKKGIPVGFFSLEDGEYLFSHRISERLDKDPGRQQYHWDGHITPDLEWEPPRGMGLKVSFNPIDLNDPKDKQRLYETILRYGLKFVVIDTLSMAIGKANVNDSSEMYSILKDVKTIAKATECAIMFIHHTRKRMFDKGESIQEMVLGSTALHAWSDFVMTLAVNGEDSDLLRMGVQTKMGSDQYYLNTDLKIVTEPLSESDL